MKDRLELVVQHSNSLNPKYFAWCIKFRDGPVCGNDSTNAGLVCFCSLRVRGQHTKTTGRRGRTVGVAKKK